MNFWEAWQTMREGKKVISDQIPPVIFSLDVTKRKMPHPLNDSYEEYIRYELYLHDDCGHKMKTWPIEPQNLGNFMASNWEIHEGE